MIVKPKKRAVVSYEKMPAELAAAFAEKYPKGFNDYFPELIKYDKPDGSFFYAVTVEIPEAVYLVKIQVKTDDTEEVEKWLEEESVMNDAVGGDEGDDEEGKELPDDNIGDYASSGEA